MGTTIVVPEIEWESDSSKFEGMPDTACRLDSSEKGSPEDPEAAGADTKYFKLIKGNEKECEEVCLRDVGCTGYEHNPAERHCELWKMNTGRTVTAYGFMCRRNYGVSKTSNNLATYLTIIIAIFIVIFVLLYVLYRFGKDRKKVAENNN